MGIAFSLGVIIVLGLWIFFGYIWDYPLRKIRELSPAKLHLMFACILPILLLSIFFPQWLSEMLSKLIPTSRAALRIEAVTLTGTLSFIFQYASYIHEQALEKNHKKTNATVVRSHLILVVLCTCMIALLMILLHNALSMHWLPALLLSVWLGTSSQVIIRIETEIFSDATKHSRKKKTAKTK